MKKLLSLALLFLPALMIASVDKISPTDAAKLVAEGKAVIVDVREPAEWNETGVAAPAVLLAKSDFDGTRTKAWQDFLKQSGDREIILYCRSGKRAGVIAETLAKEGHPVANAGGFKDWQDAGLPTRKPAAGK